MSTSWVPPAVTAAVGLLGAGMANYVNGPRRQRLMDELNLWKTLHEHQDYRAGVLKRLVDADINRYILKRTNYDLRPEELAIHGLKTREAARHAGRTAIRVRMRQLGGYLVIAIVGVVWAGLLFLGIPSWAYWVPVPAIAVVLVTANLIFDYQDDRYSRRLGQ